MQLFMQISRIIYIFSSAGWRWRYPVGAMSRFRWKLHPSSQAWPLLFTSNRGETAMAKCGNWCSLTMNHNTKELTSVKLESKQRCFLLKWMSENLFLRQLLCQKPNLGLETLCSPWNHKMWWTRIELSPNILCSWGSNSQEAIIYLGDGLVTNMRVTCHDLKFWSNDDSSQMHICKTWALTQYKDRLSQVWEFQC